MVQEDGGVRDHITSGIYIPLDPEEPIGRLERAFKAVKAAESLEKKVKAAMRAKTIKRGKIMDVLDEAVSKIFFHRRKRQN